MEDSSSSQVKHWAVLVGINFYPRVEEGGISRKECLRGAVQDVLDMEQYLKASPYPINISVLTASEPHDPASTIPTEDPSFWPTRDNLSKQLKKVLLEAKKDHFVYIHFSGHGATRPRTGSSRFAQFTQHQENVAICLYDDRNDFRYQLHGEILAEALQKMVEKGLTVTVVLDCCYSGSVLRASQTTGTAVRAVDYDLGLDDAAPCSLIDGLQLTDDYRMATLGSSKWFIEPKGYTILAACAPSEKAQELELESKERRGALTFFLLRALEDLRRRQAVVTHESLYGAIRARFNESWPGQTPMRYGNSGLSFFGHPGSRALLSTNFHNLFRRGDHLYLDAGAAQGICKGDQYVAYALGSVADTHVKVTVDVVHSLKSELVGAEDESTAFGQIQTGWEAKPLSSLHNRKIAMRVARDAYGHLQGNKEVDELQFLRFCIEGESTEACSLGLKLGNGKFIFCDGDMNQLADVPLVQVTTPSSVSDVLFIMQRLASYQYFKSIENVKPEPSFEDSFSLVASCGDEKANSSNCFDVGEGETWYLKIKNHGDKPIYMALFDFTHTWTVHDLTASEGNNSFQEILPDKVEGGTRPAELEMSVPDDVRASGQTSCEDVIKIFITSHPTLFPSMTLDTDLRDGIRGDGDSGTGGVISFLDELCLSSRHQGSVEQESWFTQNYIIRTTVDQHE